jgi:hypothetical protein
MQNLLPLILIGFFVYLIFARKGGMCCCGGHGSDEHRQHPHPNSGDPAHDHTQDVIVLRKDEYTVLPAETDQRSSGR